MDADSLAVLGVAGTCFPPNRFHCCTDLVKNQLQDTARVRGMTVEQVVEKVLLADQPTKQFVKPEDLAAMVVHLCGPHSSSITGACLSIDGGWTAR